MNVRVQFMSQLRAAVGHDVQQVGLSDGSSVADLLLQLATDHPAARTHFVTESGQPRPSLLIVVNESAVPAREAARTELQSNDVVILLPPIAGG